MSMVMMARVSVSLPLGPLDPRFDWLSGRCCIQSDGECRVLVIGGAPLLRFDSNDRVQTRLAAVMVAESKAAPVMEVQRAFEMDEATLWRWRQKFRAEGATALLPSKSGPKGPSKLVPAIVRQMVALRAAGLSDRKIGKRLGVAGRSVGRVLASAGSTKSPATAKQAGLALDVAAVKPAEQASTSPSIPVATVVAAQSSTAPSAPLVTASPIDDTMGTSSDCAGSQEMASTLAMLGLTKDGEAEIVFETRQAVPFAGALLAIPAFRATGLLEAARDVYGKLSQGIYGLRATVLCLFLMALLRRPRPEALKSADPHSLGDIMGLLRAPEVKTVRRKLTEISVARKAHKLLRSLAVKWLKERDDELGVLYIDGHVRAYHGKSRLSKAFVTQKNICAPGTTDYWVNDVDGDPIFVVTGELNPSLTQVLPPLLKEIGEMEVDRKGTVIFDRGGWSPKLFAQLVGAGWDIVTYRKGKRNEHPRAKFVERTARIDGRNVTYTLSERNIRLRAGKGKTLKLREIAELREDGGQTIFVTSNFSHDAVLLAYRMFGRWRQENYFRYMKENFALDALVDYGAEPANPTRQVPNPERKAADRQLASQRTELAKLERLYGTAAADNSDGRHRTMLDFELANSTTGVELRALRANIVRLEEQRKAIPKRIAVGNLPPEHQVEALTTERKLFTDAIKAAAYRAESQLLNHLRPHFRRAEDEGRAFLRTVVTQRGDIAVDGNTVLVTLQPMSAPRFTAALQALCHALNDTHTSYPESRYRLRYAVAVPRDGV